MVKKYFSRDSAAHYNVIDNRNRRSNVSYNKPIYVQNEDPEDTPIRKSHKKYHHKHKKYHHKHKKYHKPHQERDYEKKEDNDKYCSKCNKVLDRYDFFCTKCNRYFCSKKCATNHGCVERETFLEKHSRKINIAAKVVIVLILISLVIFGYNLAQEYQKYQNRDLLLDSNIELVRVNSTLEQAIVKVDYLVELSVNSVYLKKDNNIIYEFDCNTSCSKNLRVDVSKDVSFLKSDKNISTYQLKSINLELCAKANDKESCNPFSLSINQTVTHSNCNDGTVHNKCSVNKPSFCIDGNFVADADSCGCPFDYRQSENECFQIMRCSDKTEYGECSVDKPYFCEDGNLIQKASSCGCSGDLVKDGEMCVSKFRTGPKEATYDYILRGKSSQIKLEVYSGLNSYLSNLSRSYTCYGGVCPSDEKITLDKITEPQQQNELSRLVDIIKQRTSNEDDQVRIAVSLVQKIPYDWQFELNGRYPYEVLYDHTGVCGEKAPLLAYLLKELGYGVVLFNYDLESHMALGVKCPSQYDYLDSGYCFIESTSPTIITNVPDTYIGVGALTSTPEIYVVSSGKSFESVSEEYKDSQELEKIQDMGLVLTSNWYNRWKYLTNKYGYEFD